MAYDDPYRDPYDDWQAPSNTPAPAPAGYSGGLTITGWAAQGGSWVPIYKGSDGKLYTGDKSPWTGDPGSLRTGSGEGGKPNWNPGDPEPGTATETYAQQTQRVNTPPPASTRTSSGSGSGGGSRSSGATAARAVDPSYLRPWTETFRPPPGAQMPTWTPPPAFSYDDWQAPAPFSYGEFQAPGAFEAPTTEDVLKDPSFLFRRGQIEDTIQNSAAARGVLGSSGTLYDLGQASGNFASQEYGNIYDRQFGEWSTNFDQSLQDYLADRTNAFQNYTTNYDSALNAYTTNRNNAVDMYATNYGVNKDTYDRMLGGSNTIYDRAWREFDNRQKTFYANQDRPYDKLYPAIPLGGTAAGG